MDYGDLDSGVLPPEPPIEIEPKLGPAKAGCACCQSGLRGLFSRKLGRCPRCMRSSALGALLGSAISAIVYFLWPHPALLGLSIFVAAGFTGLLLAHFAAFMARLAPLYDAIYTSASAAMVRTKSGGNRAVSPAKNVRSIAAEARPVFSLGRRIFLLRSGSAAFLAIVLESDLFGRPRVAAAHQSCELPEPHRTNLPLQSATIWAPNARIAQRTARRVGRAQALRAADQFCAMSAPCPGRRQCVHQTVFVSWTCTEIVPGSGDFSCTGAVTAVACKCGRFPDCGEAGGIDRDIIVEGCPGDNLFRQAINGICGVSGEDLCRARTCPDESGRDCRSAGFRQENAVIIVEEIALPRCPGGVGFRETYRNVVACLCECVRGE
jgi:hypothetical protein